MISVTQALSPFSDYSGIDPAMLKAAADRGNRLHAAAAAKLTGSFRVVDLLEEDAGYWMSLSRWIDENVDMKFAVEPHLSDKKLGFVGHPDLVCTLIYGKPVVVDWKTPAQAKRTWRIQAAAYLHLAELQYGYAGKWSSMIVQPRKDGSPAKGTPYKRSAADFAIFLSCLNAYRYFRKGDK